MTIPSADNDLLIFFASSSVWPDAPVLPTFSEPARSTRYRLPAFAAPVSTFRCWIVMRKMECDRELSAFMSAQTRQSLLQSTRRPHTRRCHDTSIATLSHDLVHLAGVADIVIGQALDVNALRLLFVNRQVIVLRCTASSHSVCRAGHEAMTHGREGLVSARDRSRGRRP